MDRFIDVATNTYSTIFSWATANLKWAEGTLGFTLFDVDNNTLHQRPPMFTDRGESGRIELSSNVETITFITNTNEGYIGLIKVTIADKDQLYRCTNCRADSNITSLSVIALDGDLNGLTRLGMAYCKTTCSFTKVPN